VSGNGEAIALDSQHVATAVREALLASGAEKSDAVVFTGYSQGGIHAARMAADPRIAADFDVQGVYTVASPTGEIALGQGIEALHLEHTDDVVPAVDGRANPQGVNRTTVTFSGYVDGAEPAETSLVSAHEFGNYRAHVAHLEGQDGAAGPEADRLTPAREHLARITTGTAVSRNVTLERTRPGQPRHPLMAGLGHQFRTPDAVRRRQGRDG
jgi:dienelactone hydrolase